MRVLNFRKNFQRLGFRSPDWQRAKLLFKLRVNQILDTRKHITSKWQRIQNKLWEKPVK